MDINTLEVHFKAFRTARRLGIVGFYADNSVQVTNDLLIEIANGNYSVESRFSLDYPFEVSTKINGIKYFVICTREEFKNKFGGNVDELTTAN